MSNYYIYKPQPVGDFMSSFATGSVVFYLLVAGVLYGGYRIAESEGWI